MKYINLFLEKILKTGMIVSASIVFLVCFIQVVSRFVFQLSINWSQDVLRLCFIWSVFLGAAYCAKTNEQLNLDFILSLLPKIIREIIEIIIQVIVTAFCVLLTVYGFLYAKNGMAQNAPYIPITMAWFFSAIPVSTCLMTFFYCQNVVTRIISLIRAVKEDKA